MNLKKIHKISVVTVCLNSRDNIRLTLESVARQTFKDMEHVIIDGGSEDGTIDIIREYDVGYFISEKDQGVYHAMDKGARAANGDILIFLNAGDAFYDQNCCSDIAAFFEKTKADIVFGNIMPVYLSACDKHDHGAFTAGKMLDLSYLRNRRQLYDESIHHQATFYRSWIFKKCSYMCKMVEASGEYNVLLKSVMLFNAKILHIQRPVSRFLLGGISTRDFASQWEKYVKAREILRKLYCPTPYNIKILDENEFHQEIRKMPNLAKITRERLKNMIRKGLLFRLYERIAMSLSFRNLHLFIPHIENLLEQKAQRIQNEVSSKINEVVSTLQLHQENTQELYASFITKINKSIKEIYDATSNQQKLYINNHENVLHHHLNQNQNVLNEICRTATQININVAAVANKINTSEDFKDFGFRVFSQWDEDGLIQFLISKIPIPRKVFVEIGIGDYSEANTRLLLEKDKWSGLVIDCNEAGISKVRGGELSWKHSLNAVTAFVNCENINDLLRQNKVSGDIGLLSIDVDGVDYWIWKAIDVISPRIVICEYNGLFGSKAKVTVPYDPVFDRSKKHYSYLYAGASLSALMHLAVQKKYTLVGTNNGGNNSFFIRNDLLAQSSVKVCNNLYTRPVFRESRNADGTLSYLNLEAALDLIKDMYVFDVEKEELTKIASIPICYN